MEWGKSLEEHKKGFCGAGKQAWGGREEGLNQARVNSGEEKPGRGSAVSLLWTLLHGALVPLR